MNHMMNMWVDGFCRGLLAADMDADYVELEIRVKLKDGKPPISLETARYLCDCECHGVEDVVHFMPCCGLCMKKYIDEDGFVDLELLHKAIEGNKNE
jgi:hypothetical protein